MLNSKIARKSEQVVFQIWGWYLKKIAFSKILFCSSTKKASIWFIGQTWENGSTVSSTNIGTLGKYDQRQLWK